MSLTVGDLIQLLAVLMTAGGIIWKVSQVAASIKDSIAVLSERVKSIEVETRNVREDHDKIVVIAHQVETCRKDINQSFEKIRSLRNGNG